MIGLICLVAATAVLSAPDTIQVPTAPGALAAAVAQATPGAVLRVSGGYHRVQGAIIRVPLTLIGDGWPILDAAGTGTILIVRAPDVTIQGFEFRGTGTAFTDDRAAIRVVRSSRCTIAHNRMRQVMVGVYLDSTMGCRIKDNDLSGLPVGQLAAGNGIHAWNSSGVIVEKNRVQSFRDGIYFEFVSDAGVRENTVTNSHRYGLHFMFSHSCQYEHNTFAFNGSGIAVMYSRHVTIAHNRFVDNMGPAAFGLLLKDIDDSVIRDNAFVRNSVGLLLEGGSRNQIMGNRIASNGWGVRIMANAVDNRLAGNTFVGNAFDVGTNSKSATSTFVGNTWDRYAGYDLNHDGFGDVPHWPVRLFAVLVEQSPWTTVLLRSLLVDALDLAERALPVLTPDAWQDANPRMPQRPPEQARVRD